MSGTSFGVTPAAPGGNPVAPGELPQYLQIRVNGVDVGGPDVSVIDFVGGGITATIDADADDKTLTLTFA